MKKITQFFSLVIKVFFSLIILVFQATVTTMTASFGGGLVSIVLSYFQSGGKIEVLAAINGVLGSLVGVTGKNKSLSNLCCIIDSLIIMD